MTIKEKFKKLTNNRFTLGDGDTIAESYGAETNNYLGTAVINTRQGICTQRLHLPEGVHVVDEAWVLKEIQSTNEHLAFWGEHKNNDTFLKLSEGSVAHAITKGIVLVTDLDSKSFGNSIISKKSMDHGTALLLISDFKYDEGTDSIVKNEIKTIKREKEI